MYEDKCITIDRVILILVEAPSYFHLFVKTYAIKMYLIRDLKECTQVKFE